MRAENGFNVFGVMEKAAATHTQYYVSPVIKDGSRAKSVLGVRESMRK